MFVCLMKYSNEANTFATTTIHIMTTLAIEVIDKMTSAKSMTKKDVLKFTKRDLSMFPVKSNLNNSSEWFAIQIPVVREFVNLFYVFIFDHVIPCVLYGIPPIGFCDSAFITLAQISKIIQI